MAKGYADLHLHTVASDGTQTIDTVVRRAKASALGCIAITDHDTISPDLTFRFSSMMGLEVITGVEVKAMFGDVDGELLGYFVDPHHEELRELLGPLSTSRDERMHHMVALCRERLGIGIEFDEVRAVAGGGNIGRPHLARVLMQKGVVDSFPQAFSTLIGKGGPCYAAIEKPDYRDAVHILRAAGAAVSVAHPCLMRVPSWDDLLEKLAAAGVHALETVYPYHPAARSLSIEPRILAAKAAARGFLVTGGSDDHGAESTKMSLGSIRLPYKHVEALKRAAGI
jgi:3',5'-nucleoside bisphosphate phosphatase